MTTTTETAPLVKVRSTPAIERVSFGDHAESDAAWRTTDGYYAFRTYAGNGNRIYWVADREGRLSQHITLADANADVDWLRKHGR